MKECENCGSEFDPEDELLDLCFDCRVREVRKARAGTLAEPDGDTNE